MNPICARGTGFPEGTRRAIGPGTYGPVLIAVATHAAVSTSATDPTLSASRAVATVATGAATPRCNPSGA